jgi:hypothetical protein
MAATAAGTALTENHRRSQLGLRKQFLREFLDLWSMLDINRLDESTAAWIRAATDLILQWRAQSAERALSYYTRFRETETGLALPGAHAVRSLGDGNRALIRTSLLVTGPIGFKSRIGKGIMPVQARKRAFTAVAGAASRHVLNGGRQQLVNTASADEMSVGFSRVTDSEPCAFCAMLASRGPVYFSRATAARTTGRSQRGAGEKYHDDCGCSVEPSFGRDTAWPKRNREFEQLWIDTTGDAYGKGKFRAFRNAYEAQLRSQRKGS